MPSELPILIASVSEDDARRIEEASRLGQSLPIPLKWAPVEAGPHALEVYVPSSNDPLRVLAEPIGTSGNDTVLRLFPWEDEEEHFVERAPALPVIASDPLIGRSLAGGRFEIVSRIGEGSIGAVYRAKHTGLGIVVAVKVLHPAFHQDVEFSRRFYDEALALSQLDHPNLVHVYDFGQEPDGLLYIAMAFVAGVSLRGVLVQDGRLLSKPPLSDVERAVHLMRQVASGLGHAHSRGLIHRDVKPDNVIVSTREDDDGRTIESVKILDFGFAVPPSVSGEVAQRLAGTPVYMSPEQCLGMELDARSDVYACGIMLYELLTGRVPFLANDIAAIRRLQIEAPAPLVRERRPDLDPRVDRVVQRALAKSRDARHPSMAELRADLRSLVAPAVAQEIGASAPPSPREAAVDETDPKRIAALLAPVAARVFDDEAGRAAALDTLVRAGLAGAYALYSARAKGPARAPARTVFVDALRRFGAPSLPLFIAALEKLHEALAAGQPGAVELAEDILLAVPSILNEPLGSVIMRFLRADAPSLCRNAARALPRVWGRAAQKTLLKLLDHDDDAVLASAIVSLREIDAIDRVAVARIAALFRAGDRARTHQLRAAAMGALGAPTNDARAEATALRDQIARS